MKTCPIKLQYVDRENSKNKTQVFCRGLMYVELAWFGSPISVLCCAASLFILSDKHICFPNIIQFAKNISVLKHWPLCELGDFLMGRPVLLLQPNLFGAQSIAMEKSSPRCYGSGPCSFPPDFQNKIRSHFYIQGLFSMKESMCPLEGGQMWKNICVTVKWGQVMEEL